LIQIIFLCVQVATAGIVCLYAQLALKVFKIKTSKNAKICLYMIIDIVGVDIGIIIKLKLNNPTQTACSHPEQAFSHLPT